MIVEPSRALIHTLGTATPTPELARLARTLRESGCEVDHFDQIEPLLSANRVRKSDCLLLPLPDAPTVASTLAPVIAFDPHWPVICLCAEVQLQTVVAAMRKGAFNVLLESTPAAEFDTALNEALAHSRHRQEHDQRQLDIQTRYEHLTNREREVFALLISGQNNREIAEYLRLAIQTVKIHRARILAKMGAGSVIELLRFSQIMGHPDPLPERSSAI